MDTISLDAAEAITGISSRTLRRRASDGSITSGERDARGRATMALPEALHLVRENTGLVFSAEDARVLLQADAGDAAAQADMGALFYLGGRGHLPPRSTGCSWPPARVMPRRCTGWARPAPKPTHPTRSAP